LSERQKLFNVNRNPGPGEYYKSNETSKLAPITFSKSDKNSYKIPNTPGPCDYNAYFKPSKATSFSKSLSSRSFYLVDPNKSDSPGPGHYGLNSTFSKTSYKFGKSSKFDKFNSRSPGPGEYENRELQNNPIKFPKNKRNTSVHFEKGNLNPGPGYYAIFDNMKNRRSNSATMGLTNRGNIPKEIMNVPSCTSYTPRELRTTRLHSFGREPKNFKFPGNDSYTPGPGSYERKDIKSSLAALIVGKPKDRVQPNNVGPGSYEQKGSPIVKKSFPKDNRTINFAINSSASIPGPGMYYSPNNKSKSVYISKLPRKSELSITPGPGTYEKIEAFWVTNEKKKALKYK
jgi:hypothetical protein